MLPGARAARLLCIMAFLAIIAGRAGDAQESQATFFDEETFNSCEAFLAAAPHDAAWQRYVAWADGYLTAQAEAGGLRRFAGRSGTKATAMARLREFCQERPLESFYAAVAGLLGEWRRPPDP